MGFAQVAPEMQASLSELVELHFGRRLSEEEAQSFLETLGSEGSETYPESTLRAFFEDLCLQQDDEPAADEATRAEDEQNPGGPDLVLVPRPPAKRKLGAMVEPGRGASLDNYTMRGVMALLSRSPKGISVSLLQREFGWGYSRATEVIQKLEELGLIESPSSSHSENLEVRE